MRKIQPCDYIFKTDPFKHQLDVFLASRDNPSFGLLMEQGTGKTKVVIDSAAYLYNKGEVDTLVVIAPNGVHENWVLNEIPTHLPDYIDRITFTWNSKKTSGKKYTKDLEKFVGTQGKLRVFCINIDAVNTKKGFTTVRALLTGGSTMLVVDESHKIKSPKASRTKKIISLGGHAKYRRIMTGTPVTQGPLDLYTQFNFLDENILGFGSYYTFRNHFADLETKQNHSTGKDYTVVTGYKNLDELKSLIHENSFRVTKDECLDLPDKLYQLRYVELSDQQRVLYEMVKQELLAFFEDQLLSAPLALTKLLRLQQIIGGFFAPDDGAPIPIDEKNPRLEAMTDVVDQLSGKTIVWARFTAEIKMIAETLKMIYGPKSCVTYFGETKAADRSEAVRKFQEDENVKYFIGNPKAGGTGLTLHAASSMIYYSNDFSLETRLQSEDRCHRIGQHSNVTYIDLVAPDTVDQKVVQALRAKKNIADLITGDKIKTWL